MPDLLFLHGFATTSEICQAIDPRPATFPLTQPLPPDSIIIGWSMGALDAVKLYFEHKDKIKALVLVSAFPKFLKSGDYPFGTSPALLRKLERKLKTDLASGLEYFYRLIINRHSERSEESSAANSAPPGFLTSFGMTQTLNKEKIFEDLERLKSEDIRSLLPKIDIPVLMIHGRQDQIVPVASGEYMAEQIPNSELVIFDGAGHAPFLEEPERFNSLMKDFICKITNKK